ncbi:glycosyltransferase family 39 protein [Streptococcus rifensis]
MQKIITIAFRILNILMIGISILWLLSSLTWFWQIYSKYESLNALVFALVLVLLALFLLKFKFSRVQAGYRWLMSKKIWLILGALIFQVIVLLSSDMMIRSDAAVVFNGAIEAIPAKSISSYLSRNPNNLMLFLYERFFYHLFGQHAVWVLQGLNILYTHLAGSILYLAAKRHFDQAVADRTFTFYYFLILLTPKFMAMYTDVMVLPILAVQIYALIAILNNNPTKMDKWRFLFLGLLTGLGLAFRPTGAIIVIAFFVVYASYHPLRKTIPYFLVFLLGLGISYGGLGYYKDHQTEVVIMTEDGLSKNALTFINLGLTHSGTDQTDMKEGLLQYLPEEDHDKYNNGMFKNEYQLAEIKRRLKEYNLISFLDHTLYKQYRTTGQGNLNWIYKSPDEEKSDYINPLTDKTVNNGLAQFVRHYLIYTDESGFQYYDYFIQFIWVLLSLGLVFFFIHSKTPFDQTNQFLGLALFGGLLFLQLFEGGKSRYLIQFLPQIIFIAALGWGNWTFKNTPSSYDD